MSSTTDHYEITSDAKSTTIRLQPGIGNAAWGDIEQVSTTLLSRVDDKKSSAWLVDLSQLEYMGSALVALLVRVWKAIQAGGGKVVVVCGEGMPREVIRLAGLDKVWTISPTAADGYRTLGVRPPAATEGGSTPAQAASVPPLADGFPILGVLSFVAALAAGGALALVLGRVEIDRNLAQLGMFGGAGIAVALGLLSFFKETAVGRGLGCVALLAGIAVGIVGYQQRPERPDEAPARGSTDPDAGAPPAGPAREAANPLDATARQPDEPDAGAREAATNETPESPAVAESAIDEPPTEESETDRTESE